MFGAGCSALAEPLPKDRDQLIGPGGGEGSQPSRQIVRARQASAATGGRGALVVGAETAKQAMSPMPTAAMASVRRSSRNGAAPASSATSEAVRVCS